MALETKLKIGADTTELERAFSTLIKKIQGDADKLKLGTAASKGATEKNSSDVFRENLDSTRSKEKSTRLDQQAVQIANRALDEKKRKLDEISRKEAESVKNEKEKAYWSKERNKAEEDYNTILKTRDRLQSSINPKGGKPNPAAAPGGNGGFNMPKGGITSLGDLASFLGTPGVALAGIATALAGIKGAEGTRRLFTESQFRNREIEAQTFQTQGQGGQRLNSILNGGAAEDLTFNQDRMMAMQFAQQKIGGRYNNALSLVPKGKSKLLDYDNEVMGAFTSGNFSQVFTGLGGFFSDKLKKEFQSTRQNETAIEQGNQENTIKNGPERGIRTAIANRYLQGYQADLGTQRQLGLNDEQLRGNAYGTSAGFYGNANGAGFTNDQARSSASGIIGAGGSTRSARGNAVDALNAGRNLDITNAGSIFGKLSGSIGSDTGSKDAFVKILALGTSRGLDDSKYAEENRKFMESAASIVNQSGASSNKGLDQVMELVGKFFGGDKTTKGIEAEQNAYDIYRQKSMEQSGPTGALRAAGIMKDPVLSKLDTFSKQALFKTPINQLTSDNSQVQYWAKQAGVSPQELIDHANGVTSNSQNNFKESADSISELANMKKQFGLKSSRDTSSLDPYRQQLVKQALGKASSLANAVNPGLNLDFRTTEALVDAQSSGDAKSANKILEDAKRAQLDANNPMRSADLSNSTNAQGDKLFNNLFSSLQTQIAPTKEAINSLANNIKDLVTIMNTSSSAVEKAKAATSFNNLFGPPQAQNQQSAGPPSPNGGH